jgi:hypothetical protein
VLVREFLLKGAAEKSDSQLQLEQAVFLTKLFREAYRELQENKLFQSEPLTGHQLAFQWAMFLKNNKGAMHLDGNRSDFFNTVVSNAQVRV